MVLHPNRTPVFRSLTADKFALRTPPGIRALRSDRYKVGAGNPQSLCLPDLKAAEIVWIDQAEMRIRYGGPKFGKNGH